MDGPTGTKNDVERGRCGHEELAYLGEGGRTSYYRCRACGAGVVEDRGRFWVLRSTAA